MPRRFKRYTVYTTEDVYDNEHDADFEFEYFASQLGKLIEKDPRPMVLAGTFARWDGNEYVASLIGSFDELMKALSLRSDYELIFEMEGPHLLITQPHHDGTNHYELRRITPRGDHTLGYSSEFKTLYSLLSVDDYTKAFGYWNARGRKGPSGPETLSPFWGLVSF